MEVDEEKSNFLSREVSPGHQMTQPISELGRSTATIDMQFAPRRRLPATPFGAQSPKLADL